MTNWTWRKRFESDSYPFHTKKRRRKLYHENFVDFTKPYATGGSQYLYADPSFIKQATNNYDNRLEGGAAAPQEVYYDCYPCECEAEPQLQIFEIINEIKNPKEFKSLLKQMAYTTAALYRTFRQVYSRTKKCHQNPVQNNNKCENLCQPKECGDMNPLEIINIEIPANNGEYLEDIRYESWNKPKKKKKSSRSKQSHYKQDQCRLICSSCEDQENICSICLGPLQTETVVCCAKCSEKSVETKTAKEERDVPLSDAKQECDFSNWFPETPACLVETNVCQQFAEDELQPLSFCDRCAVLRGEMSLPSHKIDAKSDVCEKSSQTCHKVKYDTSDPSYKSQKACRPDQSPTKQVLNLNPVCVTIPLKLQIDSQNCQSRFIETEIVMEAFSGGQHNTATSIKKPQTLSSSSRPPQTMTTPPRATNKLQDNTGSDLFYSCISTSGIIKPNESPPVGGETALNEVLDIIKKRMPNVQETPVALMENRSQAKSTQMSQPESSVATTMTATKTFASTTDFTQTEQTPLPLPAAPATLTASQDPKVKAKQLRADLLEEVRATLQQTTPIAALKALLEGKRFSLPNEIRPKEVTNTAPARHSFPSNYQALATSTAPHLPLKPLSASFATAYAKPALPPKPHLPARPASFVTETVQTDASTIKASGHYKRNEMRHVIQDELKELLQPDPSKPQTKYAAEERDEILLDLHKLFHPETAGHLPKQISRENALQDISYLVRPDSGATVPDAFAPKTSDSQESIIQSIRHILNPKTQQKSKKKKYDKDTKEKILEDLQIILTPRQRKPEVSQEIRSSVLHDLRFMLETGQESTSPQRPPRLSQLQPVAAPDTGPDSSRAQQVRQQRQQKPPNEIRDSLIADLRYLLDTTHPPQANNGNSLEQNLVTQRKAAPNIPAKPNKSHSTISSEGSLSDNDKRNESQQVEPIKRSTKRSVDNKKSADVHLPPSLSSSDTFFLEMQNQYSRSSHHKKK